MVSDDADEKLMEDVTVEVSLVEVLDEINFEANFGEVIGSAPSVFACEFEV